MSPDDESIIRKRIVPTENPVGRSFSLPFVIPAYAADFDFLNFVVFEWSGFTREAWCWKERRPARRPRNHPGHSCAGQK